MPLRVEGALRPGHAGLLRPDRASRQRMQHPAEQPDPERLPGNQVHRLEVQRQHQVHRLAHLGPQLRRQDRIDEVVRMRTGEHHALLTQAPANDLAVIVLGAHQRLAAVVQIPERIGLGRRARHAGVAPPCQPRLAGRIARLRRPPPQDRRWRVGPFEAGAPVGIGQFVDARVQRLEGRQFLRRDVVRRDDDEVAVAELGGVADGKGALQIGAYEVVAEQAPGILHQVGEDGVEVGEGRGGAQRRAVLGFGHGDSDR